MRYVDAGRLSIRNCMRAVEQKLFPIGELLKMADGHAGQGFQR